MHHQASEHYVTWVEDCIITVANPEEKMIFEKSPVSKYFASFYRKDYWLRIRLRLTISEPLPQSNAI